MRAVSTQYERQEDGSGIVTETFEDGTTNVVRLPPPLLFDCGPVSMKQVHRDLLQRREDRITKLDREGR
jgi:hypothetical protein